MNYDHLNTVYSHWRKDILPNLQHVMTVTTFDEYLKRLSFLPSFKWLHTFESVKLARLGYACDARKFAKKYKDNCVTYMASLRPEEGLQRAIYQFSPTIHAEAGYWAWVERDEIQMYVTLFFCYENKEEFMAIADDIWKMRCLGNTEETRAPGFAGVLGHNIRQ